MAMTRAQWDALQAKLPQEDRMSYEEYLSVQPKSTPAAAAKPATETTPEPKVVVKPGQTLAQVAKENDTTVKAILADPRNATIAARVEAGTTPVFGNSKVAIPEPTTPAAATTPASPASFRKAEEATPAAATATPTATKVELPDPKDVPYADLTPAQRAAMSSTEKTDYIKAAREAEMAADATARAEADPMKNFAVRPEAPKKAGMIQYYSWIGGVNSGEWKLYSVVDTPENQAKYGSRAFGGTTQATPESAVGANTLINQPVYNPGTGTYTAPTTTTPTTTTPTTTTPTTTTPVTTTPVTTTPVTTTPTTTTPTTTTPTTTTPAAGGGGITQEELDLAIRKALAEDEARRAALAREAKAAEDALRLAQKVRASDRLASMFAGYGLDTLAGFISRRIQADVSEDMLLLELYDQPEYQLRFPGMKALRQKGKTITEAEYIKDEKAFAQTARFFDIPVGFYDSPDDFGKLIGNLVSPKEFQDRLQIGQDLARSMSPAAREQLQELYNIGEGGITAYVLDADRAEPILRKQAKAAQFVGFGREEGFKLEGMTAAQAERIAGTEAYAKLTGQQLQTALGQASILRQTQSRLTGIEGEVYDENEALKAVIESNPEALLASQQRARREAARFGGSGGVTGSSLRSTPEI